MSASGNSGSNFPPGFYDGVIAGSVHPVYLTAAPAPVNSYTYPTMSICELRDYTQHLCGRIKTIIDAAVTDPRQNKAFKDLVHDAFWTEHYSPVREWCDRTAVKLHAHANNSNGVSDFVEHFPFTPAQVPENPAPVGT